MNICFKKLYNIIGDFLGLLIFGFYNTKNMLIFSKENLKIEDYEVFMQYFLKDENCLVHKYENSYYIDLYINNKEFKYKVYFKEKDGNIEFVNILTGDNFRFVYINLLATILIFYSYLYFNLLYLVILFFILVRFYTIMIIRNSMELVKLHIRMKFKNYLKTESC